MALYSFSIKLLQLRFKQLDISDDAETKLNMFSDCSTPLRLALNLIFTTIACPSFSSVMLGFSHLYVLYHPQELEEAKKNGIAIEDVNFEMAQEEIVQNSAVINKESSAKKSQGEIDVEPLNFNE